MDQDESECSRQARLSARGDAAPVTAALAGAGIDTVADALIREFARPGSASYKWVVADAPALTLR